jgi:hypothetical protein
MRKLLAYLISGFSFVFASTQAVADVVDPEKYILKNGYHSVRFGDGGKTPFYSFNERSSAPRVARLVAEIELLPKLTEAQKVCDFMRGAIKSKLIEQNGIAIDVALTNYGYNGSTIACVFKYMHKKNLGTQIMYSKKGVGGAYMVFVTSK